MKIENFKKEKTKYSINKTTSVSLTVEQLEYLKNNDINISKFFRFLLNEYIEKNKIKKDAS